AIDEGDAGFGRSGGGETGIVGEHPGLIVEFADVHHVGALCAAEGGEFVRLAVDLDAGFARRLDLAFPHRETPHFPVIWPSYLALQYKRPLCTASRILRPAP